jgi:hypothetical protein
MQYSSVHGQGTPTAADVPEYDLYRILGVERGASKEDIKRAFRAKGSSSDPAHPLRTSFAVAPRQSRCESTRGSGGNFQASQ